MQHVSAEKLEGCTVLHCAAISGNPTMTRIVSYIWEEVQYKIVHDTRVQQSIDRVCTGKSRMNAFYAQICDDVSRLSCFPLLIFSI
jgi:hypothetical protein